MPIKKKKNNKKKKTNITEKRALVLKDEMEEYGKIMKSLGDRRMIVILPDSTEFLAHIPGRFRKRCWINIGDVVLTSRRSFQDEKLDIIHKYTDDEKRILHKKGEIPPFFLDVEATEDVIDTFEFSNEQYTDTNEQINTNDKLSFDDI